MPRRVQPLTDREIRFSKPKEANYFLSDGFGLYLTITPTGGKLWRFKYVYKGKSNSISLGAYPDVSLLDARNRREEMRQRLAQGLAPTLTPKEQRKAATEAALTTFGHIASEWYSKFSVEWGKSNKREVQNMIDRMAVLHGRPIYSITPMDMLTLLEGIEATAPHVARRTKGVASNIFCYAAARGLCDSDPTVVLRKAFATPKSSNFAATTDVRKLPGILRTIATIPGAQSTQAAIRMAPYLFVRPTELTLMQWYEIDGDVWIIPAEKMKMRVDHIVPLSRQVQEVIQSLPRTSKWVFPSPHDSNRHIQRHTLLVAMRTAGIGNDEQTLHGFRAVARTLLDEVLQFRPDIIEHQLAHTVRDPNGRAYNRTQHLDERRKMMQTWADYLDGLRDGAKVIPFRKTA